MILIPAQMEGITSRKDGTTRISFGTNELLPSLAGDLFSLNNKFCYLAIKPESFRDEEKKAIEQLESSEEDGGKSPSERMRNVWYILYKQDNEGYKDFTMYYNSKMEQGINKLKSRIKQ